MSAILTWLKSLSIVRFVSSVLSGLSSTTNYFVHVNRHDFFRMLFGAVLLGVLYYDDTPTLLMARFVLGFVVLITLISHVCRRILFPTLDMRDFFKAVLEEKNVAAAIVIAAVCVLLASLFHVGAMFFQVK